MFPEQFPCSLILKPGHFEYFQIFSVASATPGCWWYFIDLTFQRKRRPQRSVSCSGCFIVCYAIKYLIILCHFSALPQARYDKRPGIKVESIVSSISCGKVSAAHPQSCDERVVLAQSTHLIWSTVSSNMILMGADHSLTRHIHLCCPMLDSWWVSRPLSALPLRKSHIVSQYHAVTIKAFLIMASTL